LYFHLLSMGLNRDLHSGIHHWILTDVHVRHDQLSSCFQSTIQQADITMHNSAPSSTSDTSRQISVCHKPMLLRQLLTFLTVTALRQTNYWTNLLHLNSYVGCAHSSLCASSFESLKNSGEYTQNAIFFKLRHISKIENVWTFAVIRRKSHLLPMHFNLIVRSDHWFKFTRFWFTAMYA
jgi:hypothetical protein